MEQTIFQELLKFACANLIKEDPAKLQLAARLMAEDLKNENIATVKAAFDLWRRNFRTWPTVADILKACDEVRISDSKPLALAANSSVSTPGMGRLYTKAVREKWPGEKFRKAQLKLRQVYASYLKSQRPWPKSDEALDALLTQIFGSLKQNKNVDQEFADLAI